MGSTGQNVQVAHSTWLVIGAGQLAGSLAGTVGRRFQFSSMWPLSVA